MRHTSIARLRRFDAGYEPLDGRRAAVVVRSAADAWARFGGSTATGLVDVTTDPSALDSAGWWAVVAAYDGPSVFARFSDVRPAPVRSGAWCGPAPGA